jgi:hypothetical protein
VRAYPSARAQRWDVVHGTNLNGTGWAGIASHRPGPQGDLEPDARAAHEERMALWESKSAVLAHATSEGAGHDMGGRNRPAHGRGYQAPAGPGEHGHSRSSVDDGELADVDEG